VVGGGQRGGEMGEKRGEVDIKSHPVHTDGEGCRSLCTDSFYLFFELKETDCWCWWAFVRTGGCKHLANKRNQSRKHQSESVSNSLGAASDVDFHMVTRYSTSPGKTPLSSTVKHIVLSIPPPPLRRRHHFTTSTITTYHHYHLPPLPLPPR